MTDRDRLIKLLKEADDNASKKLIMDYDDAIVDNADYLIANGVIVPPCKVGQTVWIIARNRETLEWYIREKEVHSIGVYKESTYIFVTPICGFVESEIGVRLFLTKEEAEQALKELGKQCNSI